MPPSNKTPDTRVWQFDADLHGSSRWADAKHLAQRGYGPRGRHVLGFLPADSARHGAVPVTYSGDRHELIVAPTRGGKGVSGTIPRLLEHLGSAIVIDPKDGELAMITAGYRERVLGQEIHLIDPFDVVASRLGRPGASLNPFYGIDLDGEEPFNEALAQADACVIPDGQGESHWDGEAIALLAGLILREVETGGDLASVRAALNSDPEEFAAYINAMLASPYPLVQAAGARMSNKAERELSGVLSTTHRNTHFLESARLAASLSASSFSLRDIGENTTVYIVLPARRIRSAKRWLRLLLTTLIHAVTALPTKPDIPVLVVLEEMAALERMSVIEQSFGLMAGYGLQLLAVVQDFTQLHDLYRDRWGTFIANAASVQCFGTNDLTTARYLSDLSGQTTDHRLSAESAAIRASLFEDPHYVGMADHIAGRPLITADELMSLHPCVQFIKLAAARPVMAYRPAYFLDARFRGSGGQPLYDTHPHHHRWALPKPVNFIRPGLDLGAALELYLRVG